jgi:hypothetical protein
MSRIGDQRTSPAERVPVPGTPVESMARPGAPRKVLILQSAHPEFVLQALDSLREHPVFMNPRYALLCSDRPDILRFFQGHPMIDSIHAHSGARTAWKMLAQLRAEKYDSLVLLFTGEPGYWKTKGFAFLLGTQHKLVFNENGEHFHLTWKSALASFRYRLHHRPKSSSPGFAASLRDMFSRTRSRLPGFDPAEAPGEYRGERILILQSADPAYVLRALGRLKEAPLFSNPRYTVFCRAFPEVVAKFRHHPMLHETRCHSKTRGSWNHWRHLRREHYDAVVFLLTGEPGYWKMKCFAFLLGARHKVVFNENNDCFYFTWRSWFRLLAHRAAGQPGASAQSQWISRAAGYALWLIKFLLFPFRFAWLLIVWLRLRRSAMRAAG